MISGAVAILAYFPFFAAVHSFLADPGFRRWASRRIGSALDRWHRLAFTLLALIMVLPFLYILAFLPDRILYVASWPAFAMMAGVLIADLLNLDIDQKQNGRIFIRFGTADNLSTSHEK